MAASVHPGSSHPDPLASASLTTTAGGQIRLRRAVYVHVSDLTSAYDIDHAKLEEELARVRKERQETFTARESAAVAAAADSLIDSNSYPQKRLQPPRGGNNLCVLVGKVNVVVDKKRVDGSRVRLAEVEVGDETGVVSLRARDDQIDVLQDVSARNGAVVLRNCMLELYQGKHIRLAVTKWGKLNTYPDNVASTPPSPSKMNCDRNFSLIDLSLVASESSAALVAAGQPFPTSTIITAGTTGSASVLQQPSDNVASRTSISTSKTQSSSRQSSTQPYQPHLQQGGKRGSGRGNGGGGGGGGNGGSSNRHSGRISRTGSHQQQQQALTLQHAGGIHYAPEPMAVAAAVAIGRGYAMHQVGLGWHDPTTTPQPPIEAVPPYQTHHGYASAPGTDAAASITQQQQQMLLRQQYEMQQRQLHQMYQQQAHHAHHHHRAHQEQERQRQIHHQLQHHQTFAKSTSFGHDQPPLLPSGMVGSSPLLMPVSAMTQPPPMISQFQQQQQQQHSQYQQPPTTSTSATSVDGSPDRNHSQVKTNDEPPMSPNKMNPQAATFAPAYSTGASGAEPSGTYPTLPQTTSNTSNNNNNNNNNIPQPAVASPSTMPMPMTYAAAAYDHSQQQQQQHQLPLAPSSGGPSGFQGGQQQPQHQHQSRPAQRHHGGHHYHHRHHGGGGQQQLHGGKQGGTSNRK